MVRHRPRFRLSRDEGTFRPSLSVPSTIALEGPLRTIMDRRVKARRLDCNLIFHRTSKGRAGSAIKDYRGAWKAACKAAGLPAGRNVAGGLIPYDLRRCAVRNLVRGGTHETVAMKISGHKTRSTFDRYNIASVDDIRDAVVRTAAYVLESPDPAEGRRHRVFSRTRTEHGQSGQCAARDD
jgi:integrase